MQKLFPPPSNADEGGLENGNYLSVIMETDPKLTEFRTEYIFIYPNVSIYSFSVDQKSAISICISQNNAKESSVITSNPECFFLSCPKWWFFSCMLRFSRCICTKLVLVDPHVILIISFLLPFCQCPIFRQSLFIVFTEVSMAQNASRKPQHLNNHPAKSNAMKYSSAVPELNVR